MCITFIHHVVHWRLLTSASKNETQPQNSKSMLILWQTATHKWMCGKHFRGTRGGNRREHRQTREEQKQERRRIQRNENKERDLRRTKGTTLTHVLWLVFVVEIYFPTLLSSVRFSPLERTASKVSSRWFIRASNTSTTRTASVKASCDINPQNKHLKTKICAVDWWWRKLISMNRINIW